MFVDFSFSPVGAHQSDATVSAVTTLTPPVGATKLLLQALTQNVRYVLDGSAPTSVAGFQLKAGNDPFTIPVKFGQNIFVIEEAASATIQFQFGS